MITCQLEQLPNEAEKELRKWFNFPAFNTLLRVLDGQVKFHQTEALKDAIKAGAHNQMLDAANNNLRQAQRWHDSMELLRQVATADKPYEIAKLS